MFKWFTQRKPVTRNTANLEGWWRAGGWGHSSTSGVQVSQERALMLAAVWQSLQMISGDISKLPLNLFRREGEQDVDRRIHRSHPAYRIVRKRANIEQTAHKFWRQIMGDALLWNNGYGLIVRGGDGRPVEMYNLLPDRTAPERNVETGQLYYTTEVGRSLRVFDPYDIFHIRGLMMTDWYGRAPVLLYYAREVLGLALAAQDAESTFFKNGMRVSGVLEIPSAMEKKAKDNLEEEFRIKYESRDEWFKAIVLRDGAKFHKLGLSHQDSQTHQLREDQVREIARLFNLPPSKLGLSDAVSYNSKSEDNQAYHDNTLSPWMKMITDECEAKLLLPGEQRSDQYYFEYDASQLLQLDPLKRFQAYEIAVNPARGGWMLKSEVRAKENLPVVEGIDVEPEAVPEYGENLERDRWLAGIRERYSLAELAEELKKEGPPRKWRIIGKKGIESAIRRYRQHEQTQKTLAESCIS